jgi:hypothetical protein
MLMWGVEFDACGFVASQNRLVLGCEQRGREGLAVNARVAAMERTGGGVWLCCIVALLLSLWLVVSQRLAWFPEKGCF